MGFWSFFTLLCLIGFYVNWYGTPMKESSIFKDMYLFKKKSIMYGLKKNQIMRSVITGIISQRKECVP